VYLLFNLRQKTARLLETEEESMSEIHTEERVQSDSPRPSGFYGITVPSSDLQQSKRFLVDVLCGKLLEENARRVRVDFTNFIITAEPQEGGVIKPHLEQPHIAFDVTPEAYAGLRERLHAHGVPTTKPWGRMGKPYALTYFRDPSGNQYEFFSPEGTTLEKVYGGRRGGDYVIDFPALAYDGLKDPANGGKDLPFTPPTGYNHNTSAVRELAEAKHFVVHVLGGDVFHNEPAHVTAWVGGFAYGVAPQAEGWTLPECVSPRFTFTVKPDEMDPMRRHLDSFGIPTSDVVTEDGTDARLYFRDPSGNMLELLCLNGYQGKTRSDFTLDPRELLYDQ
jgi:catechol 2,3-dioxygenase-like lactoylglutathione lyase family enzyme